MGYFLCPVVGSGTADDPYRAALLDAGVDCAALIPADARGAPRRPSCLARVRDADDGRAAAGSGARRLSPAEARQEAGGARIEELRVG